MEKDSGSFLSFGEDEKAFVLFFKGGSYYKWNPEDETVSIVDESDVEQFEGAIYYYKQLPDQALTIVDLILFELQSVRTEIVMVLFLATILGARRSHSPHAFGFCRKRPSAKRSLRPFWP